MQYIFLNRAPGPGYRQTDPNSITDAVLGEPIDTVGVPLASDATCRLGISIIISYLDGPLDVLEATLRRVLQTAERRSTPVLIVLDGENWWSYRSDLWNWFDPSRPGFDPANRENVEWTGWDPESAVKICWRNWGRQIRVLPQPNLAAPRFRDASRTALARFVGVIKDWADRLPESKRYLYVGVKVGWEASIGINAFYYEGGNQLWERSPRDDSGDPKTGLNMKTDFAGGLPRLGYAALRSNGVRGRSDPITLADHEQLTADYLSFLTCICRRAGLSKDEIFTHAGGQYAPWPLHYSHRIAINPDSTPGWSLYGTAPEAAGDLAESLDKAGRVDWCAAEWLPAARTADAWTEAYRRTLGFRNCRFVSVYNYEGIRGKPEAIAGLRQYLSGNAGKSSRLSDSRRFSA